VKTSLADTSLLVCQVWRQVWHQGRCQAWHQARRQAWRQAQCQAWSQAQRQVWHLVIPTTTNQVAQNGILVYGSEMVNCPAHNEQ